MNRTEAYRQGMAAYNAGRYGQAIERLGPLATEPGLTGLLSRFYLGRAHHAAALEHFRRLRFREAAGHFEAAARWNPHGGGMERFLVACHVRTGRIDLAIDTLRSALAQHGDDVETRVRLALALWRNAQKDEAIALLQEGVQRCSQSGELYYQLGVMHAAREEYADAAACLEKAIELDSNRVDAHERLAQVYGVQGNPARALDLLQRAHAMDPANSRIAFQLSVLARMTPGARLPTLEDAGRSAGTLDQAAIDRLGEIIVEEPDFVSAFLSLPASDVDQEVFSVLAATLERALERHPEYADLHYHCGAVYRRLGRNVAAIEHAEQAVRMNPRFVNALILLGELYGQTERWADSVQRLEEAIRQGGDYPDVHYLLGRLLHRSGQPERAREAFERALALNREFEPARQALEDIRLLGKGTRPLVQAAGCD
ncbi:MAG TPA: tetratricopeptide repeat protein [Phycisphaerae bacterium]|nr:tetratricopeptide repeat protein [Phycisphaerae bacterium]HOJ75062.1 tetratricopeptide repeat protein [Phycisphaerae bacterium]HOM51933.1 tetratricopeptide repeat protein [Phycisphaerae bacterium]HON65818.1 tetratricopeptide repeat protein [Phycisphaerae bacterium]HOQ87032.1 tetratricopeptide repeat protein [Phycisphaerae bacterium]